MPLLNHTHTRTNSVHNDSRYNDKKGEKEKGIEAEINKIVSDKTNIYNSNSNLSALLTSLWSMRCAIELGALHTHTQTRRRRKIHTQYSRYTLLMPAYLNPQAVSGDKNTWWKCLPGVDVRVYVYVSAGSVPVGRSVGLCVVCVCARELMWNQSQQDLCYAFTFGFTIFLCVFAANRPSPLRHVFVRGRLSSPSSSRIEGSGNWSSFFPRSSRTLYSRKINVHKTFRMQWTKESENETPSHWRCVYVCAVYACVCVRVNKYNRMGSDIYMRCAYTQTVEHPKRTNERKKMFLQPNSQHRWHKRYNTWYVHCTRCVGGDGSAGVTC